MLQFITAQLEKGKTSMTHLKGKSWKNPLLLKENMAVQI